MTGTMRSYQLTGFETPLAEATEPLPEPKGAEVLLKVLGAGVCHSDVHIWEGAYDLGHGRKLSFEGRVHFPLTMGHETAGEVVAAGPDATGVKPGDKVLAFSWIGCGDCPVCAGGQENYCGRPRFLGVNRAGGYADHLLVPDARYLVPLDGLDPVKAAPLNCSGLTTYSALGKFGADLSRHMLVVMGAGGLGLMALGLMGMMGAKGAVVVEPDPAKRAAALKAGAAAAVDPGAEDAAAQIRKAAGGTVHIVLDLVGSGSSLDLGIELLARGGKVVVVGLLGGDVTIPVPYIPMRAITIQGSYVGTLEELRALVDLVKAHGLPDVPIECRPFAEAGRSLSDLRAGKVVGRVVLTP